MGWTVPPYNTRGNYKAARVIGRFGRKVLMKRRLATMLRVGAKRAMVSRALTGGALAAGAIGAYGGYRAIKAIRSRRARMSKRRKIGDRPTAKARARNDKALTSDITLRNTRNLYVNYLSNIQKGTGIEQRQTDRVIIKGFHIIINLQSLLTTSKVVVNFAIVVPKNALAVSATEFFRDYGGDRAIDFTTALNFIGMMQTPINADQYHVLWRWRVRLGTKLNNAGTNQPDDNGVTERTINKYVKINRMFNYESSATNAEADPIALVYWGDVDFSTAGGVAVASAWQDQIRIIRYFRDASY